MGRELRRKQAKKEGKSLEREDFITEEPIRKFAIITCVLIIIMCTIYLLTSLFITKELDWFNKSDKDEESSETSSNAILASAIFKQKEDTYYVYFYDFDEEKNEITSIVDSALSGEKVYKVNTASAMNANYVSEESNKGAKSLDDLKVTAPTLIKISEDSITEYYEGKEITEKLQ